jgi:3-dehydro-L-gulonate-6-phosphate decarboxylase
LKVKSFIAGRALASAQGREIAQSFHREIAKHW